MSDFRIPGVFGTDDVCMPGDEGTNQRGITPSPGPIGSDNGVLTMDLGDRFTNVLYRTPPKLPGEIREEFAMMLEPASLATMVGVFIVWGGSHYFGVGFIADAVLLVAGFGFLGWQVWSVAGDFVSFIDVTCKANSDQDLDQASSRLKFPVRRTGQKKRT